MTLFSGDCRVLRFFQKIDPTIEGWPALRIVFKTEAMSNNTSYSAGNNYVSTGVGVGTGTSWGIDTSSSYVPSGVSAYVPSGVGSGVKMACRHADCDAEVDFG